MVNVVNLAEAREARGPHITGPARCSACGHGWVGVAPVGTAWLECPSCKTMRGLFRFPLRPSSAWVCQCGCDAYSITTDGLKCVACGLSPDL